MFSHLLDAISLSRHWVAAGWTMLHFLWIGLAIMVMTLLARRLLARASAELRHAVVLFCFASLAIAPVLIYRYVLEREIPAAGKSTPIDAAPAAGGSGVAWSIDSGGSVSLHTAPSWRADLRPTAAAPRSFLSQIQPALDNAAHWMPLVWIIGVPFTLALLAQRNADRDIALTTVATMLKVMLDKGLVSRARGERSWLWSARLSRQKTTRGMIGKILSNVFEGSASKLVMHLIEDGKLTAREQAEIRAMLEEHSKKSKAG